MIAKVDTNHIMISMFEQMVDSYAGNNTFSRDQGIIFTVRVDFDNYGFGSDREFYSNTENSKTVFCHVIILSGRSVFYKMVDGNVSGAYDWRKTSPEDWKNTSNHISCYREDGFSDMKEDIRKAYLDVFSTLPEKVRPSMQEAPSYITMANLSGNKMSEFVEVEKEPTSNGFYRLLSIKKIKARLVLE